MLLQQDGSVVGYGYGKAILHPEDVPQRRPPFTGGERVGLWTLLAPAEPKPEGVRLRPQWKCRCQCGTERDVLQHVLRRGGSTSCGCTRARKPQAMAAKAGM
jgi:hypothetical protein